MPFVRAVGQSERPRGTAVLAGGAARPRPAGSQWGGIAADRAGTSGLRSSYSRPPRSELGLVRNTRRSAPARDQLLAVHAPNARASSNENGRADHRPPSDIPLVSSAASIPGPEGTRGNAERGPWPTRGRTVSDSARARQEPPEGPVCVPARYWRRRSPGSHQGAGFGLLGLRRPIRRLPRPLPKRLPLGRGRFQ